MGTSNSKVSSKESQICMKGETAYDFIRGIKGTHTYMKSTWSNNQSNKEINFTETKKPILDLFNFSNSGVPKGKTPEKFEIIEVHCDNDALFNMLFTKYGASRAVDQKDIISFLKEMVATHTSGDKIEIVLLPLYDIRVVISRGGHFPMCPDINYYTRWKMILRIT